MKIGLSFSRCLRDIYTATVDESEVLVIIARTDFDPHNDNHWNSVWYGYTQGGMSHPEWHDFKDDYDDFRRMAIRLYDTGKIHQPRQYGAHLPRLPYHWLGCIVLDEDMKNTPAVKEAWDHYQILAGLCS